MILIKELGLVGALKPVVGSLLAEMLRVGGGQIVDVFHLNLGSDTKLVVSTTVCRGERRGRSRATQR